jgi:hypothetical protein
MEIEIMAKVALTISGILALLGVMFLIWVFGVQPQPVRYQRLARVLVCWVAALFLVVVADLLWHHLAAFQGIAIGLIALFLWKGAEREWRAHKPLAAYHLIFSAA